MTRKHFEKLAEVLKDLKPRDEILAEQYGLGYYQAWSTAVSKIANFCEDSNPRFDRERFFKAAGYR